MSDSDSTKLVYSFSSGRADGNAGQRELLGGKGAGLAEMTNLGIPVPPGFTISTAVCAHYSDAAQNGAEGAARYPKGMWNDVEQAMGVVEQATGCKFGASQKPLLVSVRSGAAVSMPGMMDTILNLGLNETTVEALATETDNPRFAWDSYRRFIQMYGNVVLGVGTAKFEHLLEQAMKARQIERDSELEASDLMELVPKYLALVETETGGKFPTDPMDQLHGAIEAVLNSWNNERAVLYRRIHRIHTLKGTAVNVQAMVFGNMGEDSGTGVCFTRDPSTGENTPFGEFLTNAQGEDVVAGVRTPTPLSELEKVLPEASADLHEAMDKLEHHFKDMQDLEFTIQHGKLYLLQTRNGKRTATAALEIAADMVKNGILTPEEALLKIDAMALDQLLHPSFDPKADKKRLATGIPASPGCVVGHVALTPDRAEEMTDAGKQVILVRLETSPEDLKGMAKSLGFLTARGGKTSHAAVVARQMGKSCIAGCSTLAIDGDTFKLGERSFTEGDVISLDGALGEVYEGAIPTVDRGLPETFQQIMSWADDARRMKVRTNSETPTDCKKAREFGAEGIGLCRTEHMFFEEDRIQNVRRMILAGTPQERVEAIGGLLPMQRGDFEEIFTIMDDLPVNIRLLDPPLHEFLPHDAESQRVLAESVGIEVSEVARRVEALGETNPMLGHRGCRLGITHPEIYDMQMRAILEAAINVTAKGIKVHPEIMIPLAATDRELANLRARLLRVADTVFAEKGSKVAFQIGTMIEVPRAALTAGQLAAEAEFFSFGTNDLTQMTFGFSRDDVAGFLPRYIELGLIPVDPFDSLDKDGVGRLMKIAVDDGRATRSNLKIGICGESGGDPASIEFCESLGMTYVSCSPYRIPTARLAAAQAAIRARKS